MMIETFSDRSNVETRMRVGVGLPNTVVGTSGRLMLEWARVADEGPFSSLGTLDRIKYDSYESMTVLAATAAVTTHIKLVTSIVVGPLRNGALLAKEAATIDALSGGRFTLGLAVGARKDDYDISEVDFHRRGKILSRQLSDLRKYWVDADCGPQVTQPGGPRILVGGSSDAAIERMAQYGDGYFHGGGPPHAFARAAERARAAWAAAAREGQPALWGQAYFALTDPEAGATSLKHYYGFTGSFVEKIIARMLTSADAVRELIAGYEQAGCDELILFPAVADLAELDLLADVIE
jgi:alkanesulfonate monooxygenase SsuD/methylene tetrahydromethanopterin reductase-like flavin-dependent oxidoreductase (luciferase family)